MGICISSQNIEGGIGSIGWPYTGKIIHVDGKLQEFKLPIKVGNIISHNPNCFLCSLESMYLNSFMTQVTDEEELQLGQIYFLMPLSMSQTPLSLSNLCTLAVKASKALNEHDMKMKSSSGKVKSLFSGGNEVNFPTRFRGGCKIPAAFDVVELDRTNSGIGY